MAKYLAHGLKIRRASFTVRRISTNSPCGRGETEGRGRIFSLTSPSLCRAFFSFYSALHGEITLAAGIARKKCSFADPRTPNPTGRDIIRLCMNIVKLFVSKCKDRARKPESLTEDLLIRAISTPPRAALCFPRHNADH